MEQRVTRRHYLGASSATAIAGCNRGIERASNGDAGSPAGSPSQRQEPGTGSSVAGEHVTPFVVFTTDGDEVTATGPGGVLGTSDDTGALIQQVLEETKYTHEAGKRQMGDQPQVGHYHFGPGVFPWKSGVDTKRFGVMITGNWGATQFVAEKSFGSFFDFRMDPDDDLFVDYGPKFRYLVYDGKREVDHFLRIGASRFTEFHGIRGTGTTESMIHGKPVSGRRNMDWAYFNHCRVKDGGALAILESGTGTCADMEFNMCSALFVREEGKHDYGMILRNASRVRVNKFFTGCGRNIDDGFKGSVLLESAPHPDFAGRRADMQMCQLDNVGMENKGEIRRPGTVTLRAAADGENYNYGHHIVFTRPQGGTGTERAVKMISEEPGYIRDVHVQGNASGNRGLTPETINRPNSLELRGVEDCRVDWQTLWGDTPRDSLINENGTRNQFNGIGTNEGDPRQKGDWHQNGRDGATVVDTTSGTLYRYAAGEWYVVGQSS
jgi:hypothetical protein